MRASYVEDGPAGRRLGYGDLPDPEPGPGEVLVRVAAAPLDRVDTFIRRGTHGMATPGRTVLGRDLCGTVEAVGADVREVVVGDVVLGYGRGTHAELAVASSRHVFAVPAGWGAAEAACVPTAGRTAYDAVVVKAGVRPGDRVLVTAAAGAVGSAAVQLASAAGARVVGTVGADWKAGPVRALGAASVVSHRELASAGPYDAVVETVGGATWAAAVAALAPGGIAVCCGVSAGHRQDLHLGHLMTRGWRLAGIGRPGHDEVGRQIEDARDAFVAAGMRPLVHRRLALSDAALAHDQLEGSDFVGRLVLEPTTTTEGTDG